MRLYKEELGAYIEEKNGHIVIVEGDHELERINIPDNIDGIPVTDIGKKAFLGCKLLKEVILPDSITQVGDFAFAMCDHLKNIRFPKRSIKLGKSLFKNDDRLNRIIVDDEDSSYLLAATPIKMDAEYLMDIEHVGETEWFKMWDQKLSDILNRADDEGYHLYVLCGEEDLHFDYDQYLEYVRQNKAGLCILRLLHASRLNEELRKRLIDYLNMHTSDAKACPVFSYLLKNHGDTEAYYDILIREGIITKANQENLLRLMGDRHPQMKAYVINAFKDESSGDFFDDLEL